MASNIIEITSKDIIFKGSVPLIKNTTGKMGMLLVSVKWCPHCVNFKPIYSQFADITSKDFVLFHLDGDSAKNILPKLGVEGFPTIFNITKNNTLSKYTEPRDLFNLTKEFCKRVRTGDICRVSYSKN